MQYVTSSMTGCNCGPDGCISPDCKCQETGVCTCGPSCNCSVNKK